MVCEAGGYWYQATGFYAIIEPHFKWIGFALTIFFASWKWWDGRENVLYRRADRRLDKRNAQLRAAFEDTIRVIVRPEPGIVPVKPLLVEPSLRRVLTLHWQPFFKFFNPLTYANSRLDDAHREIAEKYTTLRRRKAFVVEQRFAAFILQGAIAAAKAAERHDQERLRFDNDALHKFDAALRVDGKHSDLLVLELKGLQLRKLDRNVEASAVFQQIEEWLSALLQGATSLNDAERSKLEILRMRNARYRAEIQLLDGASRAASDLLLERMRNQPHLFTQRLEGEQLLERAHFHETHARARAKFTRNAAGELPNDGKALASLGAATADYVELRQQFDPSRNHWLIWLWQKISSADNRDGSSALFERADRGLERLKIIKAVRIAQAADELPHSPETMRTPIPAQ